MLWMVILQWRIEVNFFTVAVSINDTFLYLSHVPTEFLCLLIHSSHETEIIFYSQLFLSQLSDTSIAFKNISYSTKFLHDVVEFLNGM